MRAAWGTSGSARGRLAAAHRPAGGGGRKRHDWFGLATGRGAGQRSEKPAPPAETTTPSITRATRLPATTAPGPRHQRRRGRRAASRMDALGSPSQGRRPPRRGREAGLGAGRGAGQRVAMRPRAGVVMRAPGARRDRPRRQPQEATQGLPPHHRIGRRRRADGRSRPAVASPLPSHKGGTPGPKRQAWFGLAAGGGARQRSSRAPAPAWVVRAA